MIPHDGIIEINYAHKKPNNMGRLWRAPYNWITGFHHPMSIINEKVKTTNQLQDRPIQLTPSSRVFHNISQALMVLSLGHLVIFSDFCWSSEALLVSTLIILVKILMLARDVYCSFFGLGCFYVEDEIGRDSSPESVCVCV